MTAPSHLKNTNFDIDDILANPRAYGMPTFEEFSRNPDKYRKQRDELFATIEDGAKTDLRKVVRRHRYKFGEYTVDSIEKLQAVLTDEGLTEDTVTWKPQVIPLQDGSGKCDILHEITRKSRLIV